MQVGYDILEAKNNKTTYRRYIKMHVAEHVSGYNGLAKFNDPDKEVGLSSYYGSGDYTLLEQDVTVEHDSSGIYKGNIKGSVSTSYGPWNWNFDFQITFEQEVAAEIKELKGTTITSSFAADFDENEKYTYKLILGVNLIRLGTYSDYVPNKDVYLSSSAINVIRSQYGSYRTVPIKATLQTLLDGQKVGESTKTVTVKTTGAGLRIKINGSWKEVTPYIRINGAWKEATAYVRINGNWKEGI